MTLLRKFGGTDRYGNRDSSVGGDDWAKPSVATYVENLVGYLWGDFSNMNAGPFPPHATHRTGNDVDGWFNGYNAIDAATAQHIIDEINASQGRIGRVYVTYTVAPGNPFYAAIENVVLSDGRRAVDVIRPVSGHRTHFHYVVTD